MCLILASSGTGAMEAAVANLFSPGDKVLVINGGKFGERWLNISNAFGTGPHRGQSRVGPGSQGRRCREAAQAASGHPKCHDPGERNVNHRAPSGKGNCQANEERAIVSRRWCHRRGSLPVPFDEWGIDVLVTGSQKALMLPPGLGFIALSDRAWEKTNKAKLPRFYFDLNLERKNQAKGSGAFTPAVSLIFGLRASLNMMAREGFDRVYARHARMARATRAAATAMGLKLLAPDSPSPAATGIFLPNGLDADKVLDYLRDQMGVILAEGQDQLKGKAIRIAHVGYMGAFDVITAIAALEMALRKFGAEIPFGRGVAAAQEVLMEALS